MCLTHTKPPCFLTKSWFECASSMDGNGIMNKWMISNWVYTTPQKRSEKIDNVYDHRWSPTLIGIYILDLSWFTCLHLCEGCYNKSHISRVQRLASEIFGRSGSDGIPITPWMSAPFRLKKTQLIPGVWYTGTMIYRINMYKWYTYTYGLRIPRWYPWFRTQILFHGAQFFGQNPCKTHRHRRRWFRTFYNKDLKMVQGLSARFSHRLYFRYARRQAVSGWGGGIEMVTPACLRSSFQLKRLARRQAM